MVSFRSIVCPIDFSEHSRGALMHAASLVDRFGARLTLVTINDPLLVAAAKQHVMDLMEEARRELTEFLAATLPEAAGRSSPPKIVVGMGAAAEEILQSAAAEQADLIVMGTHGLSGYRRLLFGSTTERVLRDTGIPVLAVPLAEGATPAAPVTFSPILVPTDLSDAADQAARASSELAGALGADLVLLHVVEPTTAFGRWRERAATHDEARVAEARAAIAERARTLSSQRAVETVVRIGRPPDEIAALASERQAGLIVMALRHASGPLGTAPTPVAYRVLCVAPVPVLGLPPP